MWEEHEHAASAAPPARHPRLKITLPRRTQLAVSADCSNAHAWEAHIAAWPPKLASATPPGPTSPLCVVHTLRAMQPTAAHSYIHGSTGPHRCTMPTGARGLAAAEASNGGEPSSAYCTRPLMCPLRCAATWTHWPHRSAVSAHDHACGATLLPASPRLRPSATQAAAAVRCRTTRNSLTRARPRPTAEDP